MYLHNYSKYLEKIKQWEIQIPTVCLLCNSQDENMRPKPTLCSIALAEALNNLSGN